MRRSKINFDPKKMEQRRIELGLTRNEFAQQLGVSIITLSSWATGKYTPSYDSMAKLCKVLDVTEENLCITKSQKPVAQAEHSNDASTSLNGDELHKLMQLALKTYSLITDFQQTKKSCGEYFDDDMLTTGTLNNAKMALLNTIKKIEASEYYK